MKPLVVPKLSARSLDASGKINKSCFLCQIIFIVWCNKVT